VFHGPLPPGQEVQVFLQEPDLVFEGIMLDAQLGQLEDEIVVENVHDAEIFDGPGQNRAHFVDADVGRMKDPGGLGQVLLDGQGEKAESGKERRQKPP